MSQVALEKIAAALEGIQQQVASLADRIAALEQQSSATSAGPEAQAAPAEEQTAAGVREEIAPEVLLAISAAVAAYLGHRAHIRAVRLIATTRWSQEGRVSIQASHYLNRG
jgi:methylmalonyl-CoA carboxyltransferase large subunit